MANLYEDCLPPTVGETYDTLAEFPGVRIERIISSARVEPVDYLQRHDEWVAVLRGAATLEVHGVRRELREGDHLVLAAGTPHRVVATSEGALWLTVHVGNLDAH
jgi:cupin 2 domain-containing protein